MAAGGARRGRRDNGLVAAEYAAAGDVDPRVGEHLLDVLGLRGIAAYLQPTADLHPVTRTTTLPDRPTDRLFVDRTHLDTARSYLLQLAGETPEATERPAATERQTPTERPVPDAESDGEPAEAPDSDDAPTAGAEPADDIDALFAAIVAGYDSDGDGAWPDAENLPTGRSAGLARPVPAEPEPGDPTPEPPADQSRTLRRWQDSTVRPDTWRSPADDRGLLDGLDNFEPDFDSDSDEGYTPPPPPPLPKIAPATIIAVLAIIAGVVIFFNPRLLPVDETVAMVFGFCGILGGFVALIWRLRPGDDDDDHWDPNDGAVV